MFVCHRKGAFTLVEMMVGLVTIPFIVVLVSAMLRVMVHVPTYQLTQRDLLALQLKQVLNRGSHIKYEGHALTYDHNGQQFKIERDGARLVKRPGYEIISLDIVEFEAREGAVKVCDAKGCSIIK